MLRPLRELEQTPQEPHARSVLVGERPLFVPRSSLAEEHLPFGAFRKDAERLVSLSVEALVRRFDLSRLDDLACVIDIHSSILPGDG